MVCQYPRAGPVSSEKHEGMPALRGRSEVGHLGRGDGNSSDGQLLDSALGVCGQQPIGYAQQITQIYDVREIVFL
jgi:hypothetical protein